jgi:hypothetical protein
VARLDEFGLRRRLAFERWFGALNEDNSDQEIVAEASSNHSLFTGKLKEQIAIVKRIIDAYPKNVSGRETLAEVKTLLDQIEPAYAIITARQREVLDLQLAGQHEKANEQVDLLDDLQRTVQNQRESMSLKMEGWSEAAALATEQRERRVFLVNDCRDGVYGVAGSRRGGAPLRTDSPGQCAHWPAPCAMCSKATSVCNYQ